jgi:hypothetical protein
MKQRIIQRFQGLIEKSFFDFPKKNNADNSFLCMWGGSFPGDRPLAQGL